MTAKNPCRTELENLKSTINFLQSQLTALGVDAGRISLDVPNLDIFVTRPRVGVGCLLISLSHPHKLLLGERMGSHGSGYFALPGGHLEANESFEDCACKEVQEECGINIDATRWRIIHTGNDPMPLEDRHYVTIFMLAHLTAEETTSITNNEPNKCKGWEWIDMSLIQEKQLFIPMANFINSGGLHILQNLEIKP